MLPKLMDQYYFISVVVSPASAMTSCIVVPAQVDGGAA